MEVINYSWTTNKIIYDDGSVKYSCKGCGKEFNKPRSVGVHAGQCKKWLELESTFVYEEFTNNTDKLESYSDAVNKVIRSDNSVKYSCKFCNKLFDSVSSAGAHAATCRTAQGEEHYQKWRSSNAKNENYVIEHSYIEVNKDDGSVKYACRGCNKEFDSKIEVRRHVGGCKEYLGEEAYNAKCKQLRETHLSENTQSKKRKTFLEKYGVDHPWKNEEVLEKRRQTNIEKYGVDNPGKSEIIQDKIKQTCIDKYGYEYALQSPEVIHKREQTNIEKYGVKCSFESEEIKSKIRETWINNYGVDHPWKSKEIQDKVKETNKKKYGYEYPIQNPDISKKSVESTIKTCMKKYGVPFNCLTDNCLNAQGQNISYPNRYMAELLQNEGCSTEFEYRLGRQSFDIIVDNSVLLEVDPTYTHNSTVGPVFRGNQRPPMNYDYHYNKSKLANDNRFHCIHVFDWDNYKLIAKILSHNKTKLYARNCEVKSIDNYLAVNDFLNNYHLQGSLRYNKSMITLGLYYNNELISIMLFGNPRYNKNYQYELLRVCTNYNYQVTGGNQKLFKYFIKNYDPESIISYCDKAKFSGKIYDKLGFTLVNETSPSCHWYNYNKHYTDNLLRMLGADKLIGTNYGKGTNNEEIMISEGYLQVYDCGQDVYGWIK